MAVATSNALGLEREVAFCGRAFGLDVEADFAIPCIRQTEGLASVPTRLTHVDARALDRGWPTAEAEPIFDRRLEDGRRFLTVDHHSQLGYRIWARGFGRHVVANDGLSVTSAIPSVAAWRWQRLLFAQVLPLAAALRGLDPFHASGVASNGQAVGFVASSGTGKTTLAAHLVASGATLFMSDDVLVLERQNENIVAHPGSRMMSVDPVELAKLAPERRRRLGPAVGRSGEDVHVTPEVVDRALPLSAVYFLGRSAAIDRLEIREDAAEDPRLLISSSFIGYLRDHHLVTHLDTCARVATSARLFNVLVPPTVDSIALAATIQAHLEEVL
jgi:hypothetical protein